MLLLIVLGAVALLCAVLVGVAVGRVRLLHAIEAERAHGNRRQRDRIARNTGLRNFPEVSTTVVKAETMPGWVYLRTTRRKGQFTEELGWSPFRWSARRKLAHL